MHTSAASPPAPLRKSRSLPAKVMRLLTAPVRSLRYKTLYALHAKQMLLQTDDFTGRRVLIIGPASTVTDELQAVDPCDFDLIVRMNKAIDVPVYREGKAFWRIDMLFHSFGTEGVRASGEVTCPKLERSGVGTVVHRTTGKSQFPLTLAIARHFRRENSATQVKILPPDFYRGLRRQLGDHSPTTGMACIAFFLACDTACLGIVGFTFYTTKYIAGYQDTVQNDAQALAYAQYKGIHDPDQELALTSRLCQAARQAGKSLVLGRHLARLLRL